MAFESIDEVTAWAEQHGGEEALRLAIEGGRFNVRSKALANAWLRQKDDARKNVRGAEEHQLRAREVSAAETSAVAAQESASAAKIAAAAANKSARWTFVAVIVAIVAVIVAVFK